jgi:hypothetical protein
VRRPAVHEADLVQQEPLLLLDLVRRLLAARGPAPVRLRCARAALGSADALAALDGARLLDGADVDAAFPTTDPGPLLRQLVHERISPVRVAVDPGDSGPPSTELRWCDRDRTGERLDVTFVLPPHTSDVPADAFVALVGVAEERGLVHRGAVHRARSFTDDVWPADTGRRTLSFGNQWSRFVLGGPGDLPLWPPGSRPTVRLPLPGPGRVEAVRRWRALADGAHLRADLGWEAPALQVPGAADAVVDAAGTAPFVLDWECRVDDEPVVVVLTGNGVEGGPPTPGRHRITVIGREAFPVDRVGRAAGLRFARHDPDDPPRAWDGPGSLP